MIAWVDNIYYATLQWSIPALFVSDREMDNHTSCNTQ